MITVLYLFSQKLLKNRVNPYFYRLFLIDLYILKDLKPFKMKDEASTQRSRATSTIGPNTNCHNF